MNARPIWLEGVRGAPSAHNTQPWRLLPLADERVIVRWDPARDLPVSDPAQRDLFLALGAAIESGRLRAAAAGVALTFTPAPAPQERTVGCLAPTAGPLDPADLVLAHVLDKRQTARTPHLARPIPADVLAALQAEVEGTGSRIYVVAGRADVRRLARLARQATATQLGDPAVHAELWRWLRLDPRDPAYRRDGLTAECLELRGVALAVARLTMPPARMRLLARLRLHHLLALDTQRIVEHSAALVLLTTPSLERSDLVRTGRLLLRLWLLAATAGLSAHPVSAVLDCAATAGPAVAVFGATGATPAALFRLGACPPVARAPRLPAEELIEQQ